MGNVYVAGEFKTQSVTFSGVTLNNANVGTTDAYILKYTIDGVLIWAKRIGGVGGDNIQCIETDSIGNLYLAGNNGHDMTVDGILLNSSNLNTGFFGKLDSNGTALWFKKTINNNINDIYSISSIKVNASNEIFIGGSFRAQYLNFNNIIINNLSYTTAVNTYDLSFLAKFDANGNCLWGKAANVAVLNPFGNRINSIAPDTNGGVVITGEYSNDSIQFGSLSFNKAVQGNNASNSFIVNYSSTGNELWGYSFGNTSQNSTFGTSVAVDTFGNVYMGGNFPDTINILGTTLNTNAGSQFFLAKFNSIGQLSWAKAPIYAYGNISLRSLAIDESSNVYLAGSAFISSFNLGNGITLNGLGNAGSVFIIKYDELGTPIWTKGIANVDYNAAISLSCNTVDDIFLFGTYLSSTITLGNTTLNHGNQNTYDRFLARLKSTPLSTIDFEKPSIVLYPNPIQNELYFKNLSDRSEYSIFSNLGILVKEGIVSREKTNVNIEDLQQGSYFVILKSAENESFTFKIVKI